MAKQPDKNELITVNAAQKLLKSAPKGKTLTCSDKRLKGLRLIKLGNSASWQYRYADATGKRRVYTIGSFPELKPIDAANKVLDIKDNEVDPLRVKQGQRQKAIQAEEEAAHRTLRAYLDGPYYRYMEREWKPENLKQNHKRIHYRFPHLLDRELGQIRSADIDAWQADLESRGLTHGTVKRDYSRLKALIRHALKKKVIPADPLQNHELEKPSLADRDAMEADSRRADRRMLTAGELQGLYLGLEKFAEEKRAARRSSRQHGKSYLPDLDQKNFAHWFHPYILIGLHLGLRPGDIFSLEWRHINFEFRVLTKQLEKTRRKNSDELKLPLNDEIFGILKRWHDDLGNPESGLLFRSERTGGQMDSKAYRKPWIAVKRLGGLPESLPIYSLRHNFISALLANGEPVFSVARLAGHQSSKMIEKHYGHLCPDRAASAMDALARTLNASTEQNFVASQKSN